MKGLTENRWVTERDTPRLLSPAINVPELHTPSVSQDGFVPFLTYLLGAVPEALVWVGRNF